MFSLHHWSVEREWKQHAGVDVGSNKSPRSICSIWVSMLRLTRNSIIILRPFSVLLLSCRECGWRSRRMTRRRSAWSIRQRKAIQQRKTRTWNLSPNAVDSSLNSFPVSFSCPFPTSSMESITSSNFLSSISLSNNGWKVILTWEIRNSNSSTPLFSSMNCCHTTSVVNS